MVVFFLGRDLCVHTVVNLSVAFAIFQQPFVCLIKELDNLGAVTKSLTIFLDSRYQEISAAPCQTLRKHGNTL
jgi:hypothetical protein